MPNSSTPGPNVTFIPDRREPEPPGGPAAPLLLSVVSACVLLVSVLWVGSLVYAWAIGEVEPAFVAVMGSLPVATLAASAWCLYSGACGLRRCFPALDRRRDPT